MQCPACDNVTLVMADRQGVEIDYCPQCRGVWLDRGELDKIIDRSAALEAGPAARSGGDRYPDARHGRDYDDDRRQRPQHRRKKKGFLGEMFDFD
ncbi:MAG TPA: zf-TFIIB domain-containing protein [Woeseiaceae bacterium]|nr:zf-TFIIB domain-containing protein [Woeseiaceae bacterium]